MDTGDNSAAAEQTEFAAFPEKLNAEKVGSFKLDGKKSMKVTDGGIYSETEDGKYGVATLGGKKDAGQYDIYIIK